MLGEAKANAAVWLSLRSIRPTLGGGSGSGVLGRRGAFGGSGRAKVENEAMAGIVQSRVREPSLDPDDAGWRIRRWFRPPAAERTVVAKVRDVDTA